MQPTFIQLDVHTPPPNLLLARIFVHDPLVLRATTSLLSREIDESARLGDDGTFIPNGIFIQLCRGGISPKMDLIHIKTGLREVLDVMANH